MLARRYFNRRAAKIREAARYEDDTVRISADVSGLQISTQAYGLYEMMASDTAPQKLLENPLISTAIQYLGLENPQVIGDMRNNQNGNLREYAYDIVENNADLSKRM